MVAQSPYGGNTRRANRFWQLGEVPKFGTIPWTCPRCSLTQLRPPLLVEIVASDSLKPGDLVAHVFLDTNDHA